MISLLLVPLSVFIQKKNLVVTAVYFHIQVLIVIMAAVFNLFIGMATASFIYALYLAANKYKFEKEYLIIEVSNEEGTLTLFNENGFKTLNCKESDKYSKGEIISLKTNCLYKFV